MTPPTIADLEGRIWFSTSQAALYAGLSRETLVRALRDGTLRGSQRSAAGNWRIHRDDLDAWLRGESA